MRTLSFPDAVGQRSEAPCPRRALNENLMGQIILGALLEFVIETVMWLMSVRAWLWTIAAIVIGLLLFAIAHSYGLVGS